MTQKFSYFQRQQLKQLVMECDVMRLSREESLAYIKGKFKQDISIETIDHLKARLRKTVESQLNYLRKNRMAYIEQYFQRINEIKTLQKTQWNLYIRNHNNPIIQSTCLKELHLLTITLSNLWDILPRFTGMTLSNHFGKEDISEYLERNPQLLQQGQQSSSIDPNNSERHF